MYADLHAASLDDTADSLARLLRIGMSGRSWRSRSPYGGPATPPEPGPNRPGQLLEAFPARFDALAAGQVDMPEVLVICELAG